jgi:shikimate kinase
LEKRLVDTQRPLLSEGDLGKQIAKLLKERSLAYQGFQMTIDTTNLSVNETIREIITQLEK